MRQFSNMRAFSKLLNTIIKHVLFHDLETIPMPFDEEFWIDCCKSQGYVSLTLDSICALSFAISLAIAFKKCLFIFSGKVDTFFSFQQLLPSSSSISCSVKSA